MNDELVKAITDEEILTDVFSENDVNTSVSVEENLESQPAIEPAESIETMPPLYAPLSPPAVGIEVTNGFAHDVLGYAEDILKGKPSSEYLLYGNSHLSWILVTADHFGSVEDGEPCFYGDVVVYHIYQDEYIPNQPYTTWFFDTSYPETFVPDSDIENYMVYASPAYGDYPRITGVIEDAQTRYHVLFGVLLPVVLLSIILQQIYRRFG